MLRDKYLDLYMRIYGKSFIFPSKWLSPNWLQQQKMYRPASVQPRDIPVLGDTDTKKHFENKLFNFNISTYALNYHYVFN